MIRFMDLPRMAWSVRRHRRAARHDLARLQEARLRRLVTHAYENVPYYRALFDRQGLEPRHIRTVADLGRIPVTSKRDLQVVRPMDIVARGFDPARLLVHMTSGSSGEPVTIRRTWLEERHATAFRLRAFHDFGVRPWDRWVGIGAVRPHDPRDWDLLQRSIRALGLYRKTAIDCRRPIPELVARLDALRPDVIIGFPGVLSRIGHAMAQERPRALRPRLVIAGGEVLTPLLRRQIAESFRASVLELYATYEFGVIAWQCRQGSILHVADDSVIVEVLRDGRPVNPGETGEVVVTRLHAFAMPFIRYRLGDIVTLGDTSCPCGAPFSTILTVQGRMLDYFPLAGGRLLHPYELTGVILERAGRWIGQYQLTQERPDRVVLRVAPLATPSSAEVAALEQAGRGCLGPGIDFRVLLVGDIPLEINGKFRVSRSLVESVYDGIDWEERRAADLTSLEPSEPHLVQARGGGGDTHTHK
jgi:phenylacetate-coenzyme A ligase PaaK-like adenylate-forming protein